MKALRDDGATRPRTPAADPGSNPSEVAELIAVLRGRDWQTARDLGAKTEAERRVIRAVAEAAAPQIISGQKGYKLNVEATPEEMEKFKWLLRQAKTNMGRYVRTVRFWHGAAHHRA